MGLLSAFRKLENDSLYGLDTLKHILLRVYCVTAKIAALPCSISELLHVITFYCPGGHLVANFTHGFNTSSLGIALNGADTEAEWS